MEIVLITLTKKLASDGRNRCFCTFRAAVFLNSVCTTSFQLLVGSETDRFHGNKRDRSQSNESSTRTASRVKNRWRPDIEESGNSVCQRASRPWQEDKTAQVNLIVKQIYIKAQ